MPRSSRFHRNERGSVDLVSSDGVAKVGSTLSAQVVDGDGICHARYRWKIQGEDGRWTTIDGASSSTLVVDESLAGHKIKVITRYTDHEGHRERHVDKIRVEALDSGSSDGGATPPGATPPPVGVVDPVPPAPEPDPLREPGSSDGGAGEPQTPPPTGAVDPVEPAPEPDPVNEPGGSDGGTADPGETPPPMGSVDPAPSSPTIGEPGKLNLGINLAGAEFGERFPGTFGTDYTYPTTANVDYYADRGFDSIRLPFKWERIQNELNGPLDEQELARMDAVVDYASSRGLEVVLDVHNYGFGHGALIGSSETPNSAFADLWSKIATHYKDNPYVVFGLMNEPYEQSAEQWLDSANAAVAAIREAGATQTINVPGTYFDGAWTWISSDNDTVIGEGVIDPLDNFRFEVHQYLDSDGSGTSSNVVSESIGVERLAEITAWAEQTGNKLYLGEFGVADNPQSLAALDNMLGFMQEHSNIWEGAAYWAGGPWWGDYMFSAEPENGVDKPQMDVLSQYA